MLRRHEEVQQCILDMTRRHSKMVANLAHFGTGEGKVFHELRDKTEDVWQEVRLRCKDHCHKSTINSQMVP
jgi:hypothetical protein